MFVRNFMCFSSSLFEIHRFEEISVSICAGATSKFFALNEAVLWSQGSVLAIDAAELQENSGFVKPLV